MNRAGGLAAAAIVLLAATPAPAQERPLLTTPPLTAPGPAGLDRSRVANTRHNLSASGAAVGNTFYAPGETQVCVFCHTPCADLPQNPQWNHELSGARYDLYASSTAKARTEQPRGVTKLCLSCHDGTVALGAVLYRPSTGRGRKPKEIAMAGGLSRISSDSPGYIGTDLRTHHPVVVRYDEAALDNPEMRPRPEVSRRHPLPDGEVHCTSCHDPHDDSERPFLVAPLLGSELCLGCHEPRGSRAAGAVHFTSPARWNGMGQDPFRLRALDPRLDTVAANGCGSCHRPHGAKQPERLLVDAGEKVCLRCHDGNVAGTNLASELAQGYRHAEDVPGRHDAREGRDLTGDAHLRAQRHATCVDCHEPHAAGRAQESVATAAAEAVSRAALVNVAARLAAPYRAPPSVAGVRGQYGATAWERPVFAWVAEGRGVDYQYELCFKCHSSYAYGTTPPSTRSERLETDPAVEFNPNNPSYHAVVGISKASGLGKFVPPWSAGAYVACTDCHGAPDPGGSRGVHGSPHRFLLRGRWSRSTGENAGNGNGRTDTRQDLCFRCHDFDAYTSGGLEGDGTLTGFRSEGGRNLHALHARRQDRAGRPAVCRDCHVAVPHGWTRKRLIALRSDAAPYNDGAAIDSWDEPAPGQGYTKDRCATACH